MADPTMTVHHVDEGTRTDAFVGLAAVNVINAPEMLRAFWPRPTAAELREIAQRAAEAQGRTLKRGAKRFELTFMRNPMAIGYGYLLEDED